MPGAEQPTEAQARQFLLTTVWQGLSELADWINATSDRIATVRGDPTGRGRVSLRVCPVRSEPTQAAPLFRYDVTVSAGAANPPVQFVAQPAVVTGQLNSQEQGDLAMTAPGGRHPRTPQDICDEVARRYQAVIDAQASRRAER